MYSTTRLLQLTGTALVTGAIAVLVAAPASAVTSAADSAFLSDLRAEGIGYESAGDVIAPMPTRCAASSTRGSAPPRSDWRSWTTPASTPDRPRRSW